MSSGLQLQSRVVSTVQQLPDTGMLHCGEENLSYHLAHTTNWPLGLEQFASSLTGQKGCTQNSLSKVSKFCLSLKKQAFLARSGEMLKKGSQT